MTPQFDERQGGDLESGREQIPPLTANHPKLEATTERVVSDRSAMITATLSSTPAAAGDKAHVKDPKADGGGAVALPCSTIAFHYRATKAPKETLKAVYKAGEYKAGLTLNLLMVQSFMAGVYIGAAGHLYLTVGGGLIGSAFFPTGLIAVVLTSAELFTGDSLVFIASVLGGKVSIGKLCRNWTGTMYSVVVSVLGILTVLCINWSC
jgi:hypothetical protein